MDSNLERLPYLARQLERHTPAVKDKPARDSELFTFARRSNWKEGLDGAVLNRVAVLLKYYESCLSRIRACPETVPPRVLRTLVAYYVANRPEDSDWVVLPVINFDCYFGGTNFGRKYLAMLPDEIIQRSSSFGVSRYRVREEYLPK